MKNIAFENRTQPFYFMKAKSLTTMLHFHKDIEIIYVLNGKSYACADRKKELIKSGDLFISFPNQIHNYQGTQIGDYLVIIFSPEILFDIKDIMYGNTPKSNVLHNMNGTEFLKLIETAYNDNSKYGRTLKAGIINQLIAIILMQLELKPRIKTNISTLQEILNYCSENFSGEITLDDVSDALHINKYHISHLLNDKLGLSFNAHINSLRINRACDLIEDTDKKMADISEEVGFGSIRSFNRAFFAIMDMSPIEYRNRFRL